MSSNIGVRAEPVGWEDRCRCSMRRRATVMCGRIGPNCRKTNARAGRTAAIFLLILIATVAAQPLFGSAAQPAVGSAAPSAAPAPTVAEWLNQNVRLRETVQALDQPSADGKPSGEIRAGAEVRAIGLVEGKHWVQIELPDHSLAYVPREAIEFENGAATPAPAAAESAMPPTTLPTTSPSAAIPAAASGVLRGPVTRVPNAATLVVSDQRIRLSGIDPGPQEALAPFENWVRGQGALTCEPDAQTGRYHCFTGDRVDVAEAAILNGAGRVGDGATPAYRDSETAARQARRGLWSQP
jgi:endonuclease YncB( thermonuclease family)